MRGTGIEVEARKQILIVQRGKLRSRMADMQKTLNRLDHKIDVIKR